MTRMLAKAAITITAPVTFVRRARRMAALMGAVCATGVIATIFAVTSANRAAAAAVSSAIVATSNFVTLESMLPPPQMSITGGPRRTVMAASRSHRDHVEKKTRKVMHPSDAQASGDPRPISSRLLAALIHACAPSVNPVTQAAVISVESSGDAWSLHDDNDGREYRARSFRDAVRFARRLIAFNRQSYGANDAGVDVGIGQINSNNFANLGVDAGWMLHPCPNLRVSSMMIAQAYDKQYAQLRSVPAPQRDQLAIRRALQVYNSGRPSGDDAYVASVINALHSSLVADVSGARPLTFANLQAVTPYRILRRSVNRVVAQAASKTGLFVHEDPPPAAADKVTPQSQESPAPVSGP
jgi:type IV secretion system protein VirB1